MFSFIQAVIVTRRHFVLRARDILGIGLRSIYVEGPADVSRLVADYADGFALETSCRFECSQSSWVWWYKRTGNGSPERMMLGEADIEHLTKAGDDVLGKVWLELEKIAIINNLEHWMPSRRQSWHSRIA